MLVSALPNVRYLSGFTGSAGLLVVLPDAAVLLADGRYEEAARQQAAGSGVDVVPLVPGSPYQAIGGVLGGAAKLLFDPGHLTVEAHSQLAETLPGVRLVQAGGLPERLRLRKDVGEIARIRAACRIALAAFEQVSVLIETEPTEKQFAVRLESQMRDLGADGVGFPSIVASGPNSSMPHAQPSDRVIREGEPVVVDFGALVDGYHCDITRTIWCGELDEETRRIYRAAEDAHAAGIEAARSGVPHSKVDAVCREVFVRHGYPDRPLHPSGHNLGLSIHERPFLTPQADEPLLDGYVITVEPGLYVRSVAGCRIEDTLLVGAGAAEVLSAPQA
jgi:Xaa-Pro aminopeptidase